MAVGFIVILQYYNW